MVDATAEPVPAYQFDDETKTMTLTFSDLYLVSTEGGDVFALNLNEWDHPPPFYLDIEGRLFAMQPSNTYLVTGYGARLPEFIQSEEAEGADNAGDECDGERDGGEQKVLLLLARHQGLDVVELGER